MNRKLIVTLLHKNIEELNMITESFMEMEDYPAAIVHIAKRKTEDIQLLIEQLAEIKPDIKSINVKMQESVPVQISNNESNTVTKEETEIFVEKKIEPEIIQSANQIDKPSEITNQVQNDIIETKIEEPMITVTTEEPVYIHEPQTIDTQIQEIKTEKTIEIKHEELKIEETEIKITTEESRKTTIADKIIQPTVSRNEAHSKINDNSLSATIANKKISDIKTAISIGDRFRFQRELFRGNGEDMNKTLNYINQLATYEEVYAFLQSKYAWDEENENVEDFYQIVKRKFL